MRPLSFLCLLPVALAVGCHYGKSGPARTALATGAPSAAAARFAAVASAPAGTIEVAAAQAAVDADLDGDGRPDLIVRVGNALRLFLRTGTTTFVEQVDPVLALVAAGAVATLDADRDGDLDLIVGGALGRADRILLNDGRARFSEGFLLLSASSGLPDATAIAVGDVDRDGLPDFLIGRSRFAVQLFLAQAVGGFLDTRFRRLPPATPATAALLLSDLDQDGDLDIVVGAEQPERALLWQNDGSGFFRDVSLSVLPVDSFGARAVAAGDVDLDGDLDLVVGRADGVRLWDNESPGTFRDRTTERVRGAPAGVLDLTLADLDRDGDLDIVTSGITLLFNTGGQFDRVPAREPEVPASRLLVLDLEPDGLPDLLALADARIVVFRNQDHGALRTPAPNAGLAPDLASADTTACRAADVNGDLIPDLLLLRAGAPAVLLGFGAGDFRELVGATPTGLQSRVLEVADVDRDGDADLVLDTSWLRNDGGSFLVAMALPAPRPVAAVAAGDLDGDGDVDLASVGEAGSTLLLNDGTGVFTDRTDLLPPSPAAVALLLLDVDLDLDLDFLSGGDPATGGAPRLFVNLGPAGFADRSAGLPAGVRTALTLAAADLDGDRDPDLVLGVTATVGENLFGQVLLGDGNGVFLLRGELAGTLVGGVTTRSLQLADLDGDAQPDLVAALTGGSPAGTPRAGVTVLGRNRGLGQFEILPGDLLGVAEDHGSPATVLAADLDLDGDADLLAGYRRLADGAATAQLRFNLFRHLQALAAAWRGAALPLRVTAFPGQAPADLFALPYVALGLVVARVPFGTWLLGPAGLTPLPVVQLPSPAGAADFSFAVPDDAGLLGQRLHLQALLLRLSTGTVELTNAVVEPVR